MNRRQEERGGEVEQLRQIVEQEPVPFKTGLELMEMAVGESRQQWFEVVLRHDSLFETLVMVGENGIRGALYLTPYSYPYEAKDLLNAVGAIRSDIPGQIKDPSDYVSMARRLKELREKEVILLVFKEEPSGHPQTTVCEIPAEPFNHQMGKFRKKDNAISRGELIDGGYRLSTGMLSLDFPSYDSPEGFSYGILVRKKRPFGQNVEVGEAMPWIEAQLEASRKLEQFLVENWTHFERLFENWQK